ncbi:MAG: hypothetical protein ACK4TA_23005 [Saprospiraceae bacterium]
MKTLFTLVLAFTFSMILAQTPTAIDPEQNLRTLGNLTPLSAGAMGFDNRYQGVQGTPFLFTEFQTGTIQFTKQDTFSTPFKLNVDLIKNTLLVQMKNGSLGEVSANNLKALQFSNLPNPPQPSNWIILSEKEVEGNNSVREKFYGVLHNNQYRLLKSIEKTFKKASYQGAYNSGNTYDEFLTEEVYWLSAPGKPFEKIKLKRKDLEKALSAEAAKVQKIAKDNKLDLNDYYDIIQLLVLLEKGN